MKTWQGIAAGAAAVLATTALWHELGGGEEFATRVEQSARTTLDDYEMTQVRATLERGPLRRRLILSGPADDFQRSELLRIMGELPGIAAVRWTDSRGTPGFILPLAVEASLMALTGFALGLLLAYLVELRRRYNASWRW